MNWRVSVAWLSFAVCHLALPLRLSPSDQTPLLSETEEVIGELSESVNLKSYESRPEMRTATTPPGAARITWTEKSGKTVKVIVDGQSAGEFDTVLEEKFSPDGRHVLIQGLRNKELTIVLDGKTVASGKDKDYSRAVFSQAGQLVYAERNGKQWNIVVDGQRRWSSEGNEVKTFAWNVAGEVAAFEVQNAKGSCWIVNGEKGPDFDRLSSIVFSDNGRFAYVGIKQHAAMFSWNVAGFLIVDGKQIAENHPRDNYKELVVWPSLGLGTHTTWAKSDGVGDPAFSRDGKHLGYAVSVGPAQTAVVIDGAAGPTFNSIVYGPFFTPDGNHFAYLAVTENHKNLAEVYDHKIVREVGLDGFDHLGRLAKNSNASRFALAIGKRGNAFTGRGPVMLPPFRVIADAKDEGESTYTQISQLEFSPNGRHLFYYVRPKTSPSWIGEPGHVVIDGKPGKTHGEIIPDSLGFIDDNTFRYAARDGRKFVRVTMKIE